MADQFGILAAYLLVCACLSYLSYKGWSAIYRRRSFSLWDLLVVLTLIAAIAGLIVGLAKGDKSGLPRHMRFSDFYNQWLEANPDNK